MFFEEKQEGYFGRLFFRESFLQLFNDINRAWVNSSQHRKITAGEIPKTHEVHHFCELTFSLWQDFNDIACSIVKEVTHEIQPGRHIDDFLILITK
jgi:protein tyrosine phosphatase